ncbi:NEQ435 [Nanoarchaeum equitans Kin4-M]|uniref:NEQ435 n=1 Tax=Nanoarchaeum equitans (strain Kin4-M) TaxID=228908 RepID=Q74M78_NANEQ|nr:NEQ435 [Nanoarchaeum equitans Kin4-M]
MRGLIIGYDPGEYSAIAIFDLKGNLLYKISKKDFREEEIISVIHRYGKPLVIATDKKIIPKAVERLAMKLKSKIFSPKDDLPVSLKKELAKDYSPNDNHERDAIASAVFALNYYSPLIKKIEKKLEELTVDSIFEKIIKNGISITDVLDSEFKIEEKKEIKKKSLPTPNCSSIIEEYKQKIDFLIEENMALRKKISQLLEMQKLTITIKIETERKEEKEEIDIKKILEQYREKRIKELYS